MRALEFSGLKFVGAVCHRLYRPLGQTRLFVAKGSTEKLTWGTDLIDFQSILLARHHTPSRSSDSVMENPAAMSLRTLRVGSRRPASMFEM